MAPAHQQRNFLGHSGPDRHSDPDRRSGPDRQPPGAVRRAPAPIVHCRPGASPWRAEACPSAPRRRHDRGAASPRRIARREPIAARKESRRRRSARLASSRPKASRSPQARIEPRARSVADWRRIARPRRAPSVAAQSRPRGPPRAAPWAQHRPRACTDPWRSPRRAHSARGRAPNRVGRAGWCRAQRDAHRRLEGLASSLLSRGALCRADSTAPSTEGTRGAVAMSHSAHKLAPRIRC